MSDQEIIDLITTKFQTGFMHPGDPDRDIPPTPIVLPFKPSPGMPKEMGDLLSKTAKLLAECIVSTIKTEGNSEIVPKAEAAVMRRAIGEGPTGPSLLPVFCHCNAKDPLMVLSQHDPDRVQIDGRTMLRNLHRKAVACPHGPIGEALVVAGGEVRAAVIDAMESLPKTAMTAKASAKIVAAMDDALGA